ncbi:MAG: UDP-N-acetylglucosamine 3-dehydrogenase [Thermoplasmata archaeon]
MMKVGVVGVGMMGQHHARVYSELSDLHEIELIGVVDTDIGQAKNIAKKYNTKAYESYKKFVENDLDAVSIAVPTSLHKEIALEFIDKGVNVLIEKPIADSIENAEEIIQAAKKNDVVVSVGHIERYNPAVLKLKEVIEDGVLGDVISISAKRVGPMAIRIRDVGIIIDLAVHDIDVISYLLDGKVKAVNANAGNVKHPAEMEDHALIMLQFPEGKTGIIETNWLTPHKTRKLNVVGTKGIANMDYINQSLVLSDRKGEINVEVNEREPLKNELENFVNSVLDKTQPLVDGETGLYVLMVALAAQKSSKTGELLKV